MERTRETDWALSALDWIAVIILIIGGLNWGCVGLFNFNVIGAIFGDMTVFTRFLYIIVGLAGLWSIIGLGAHVHQHRFETPQTPGAVVR
jgi:uncharacterized membrane protein YuzA (DUF378 family)